MIGGERFIRIISHIKSGFSIFDSTADRQNRTINSEKAITFVKLDFLCSFIEHIE